MSEQPIIEIQELTKFYRGNDKPAVDHLSLNIHANEIFGLLGPNGAGKTTTISILCGLFPASKGSAKIDGLSIATDKEHIKRLIGVVPQEIALYPSLTAKENLRFIGGMYGLSGTTLRNRITECLKLVGLEDKAKRKIGTFSGGMKRRINLIAGLLHNPKILFLDEPTVGVDVQSRNMIIEYLRHLHQQGTTIIYSSHYLEEAQNLCTRVAIIDNGKVIATDSPAALIQNNAPAKTLEDLFLKLTGKDIRD
jgi:ABC-2 type transport system ATP-binding protein